MRRTIMTSAIGVTLMSAIGPPFLPPTAIAMATTPSLRRGPAPVASPGPRIDG
jgi:hypothetical protein